MLARFLLFIVGFSLPVEALGAMRVAGYPIGVAKPTAALLLAYSALVWVTTGRGLPWNLKHAWAIALLVFLTGLGGLSSLFQGTPVLPLATIVFSHVLVVLFYFLVAYLLTSLREVNALLAGIVAGCIFSGSIGFFIGSGFESDTGRYEGSTSNANMLSYNMTAGLAIALGFFFSARAGIRKLVAVGATGVILMANVLSLSRSGFLSMGLMWGLWAVRFRRLDTIRYMVIPLLLGVGVLFLAPDRFWARMDRLSPDRLEEEADSPRAVYAYWGLVTFARNPIVGVGLGRISIWVPQNGGPNVGVPHNAYLHVAAETGIIGLIPLLALTWLGWRDFSWVWGVGRRRPWSADPQLKAMARVAVFLQIGFLGLFVFSLLASTVKHKMFWCFLGLSSALYAMARERVRALQAEHAAAALAEPDPAPIPEGGHGRLVSH